MIISASRRTDIPAFFGEWFINRLRAGEVLVRNPLNRKQVSLIPLKRENVDCFVFWTRDPGPFLKYLDEIDGTGIPYYFTITITPYGSDFENNVRPEEQIVASVRQLAGRIGSGRIVWRYDPVIFSPGMDRDYHIRSFTSLAEKLEGATEKCVFSFLEEYGKIASFLRDFKVRKPDSQEKSELIGDLSGPAEKHSMKLASCAQDEDYSAFGVEHNSCIDPLLISKICDYPLSVKRDASRRPACGCAGSRDIGTYNSCLHGCLYCYANRDRESVRRKASLYDPRSPLLCDSLSGDEAITLCGNCGSLKSGGTERELFD